MRRLVGALVLAGVLASVRLPAQQESSDVGPPVKTTFVSLANNANAIIVEPVSPDPQRARVAILLTHPEHLNTFNYFIGRELSKRGYRVMMMNYYGPEQAAQEWYQRERVIPINHMFVVREELSKERPDVVRDIYRMIVAGRQFAPESPTRPPIGLEANRKSLELAIQWSYEQKIIPRRLSVDELFDDTTAALEA